MTYEEPSFTAMQLENKNLREKLKTADHLRLRDGEERKRILDQRNTAIRERDHSYDQIETLTEKLKTAYAYRDMTLQSNSSLREELIQKDKTIKALEQTINDANHTMCKDADTISNLKSELNQLEQDYASMKARFHGANYGIGCDVFAHIILGKTATEVMEKNNLEINVKRLQELRDKLISEINAMRKTLCRAEDCCGALSSELLQTKAELSNLKHLCHERGFGTPVNYWEAYQKITNKPKPIWKATFVANNCIKGVVTFEKAPTVTQLDQLQKTFEATSWSVNLP